MKESHILFDMSNPAIHGTLLAIVVALKGEEFISNSSAVTMQLAWRSGVVQW